MMQGDLFNDGAHDAFDGETNEHKPTEFQSEEPEQVEQESVSVSADSDSLSLEENAPNSQEVLEACDEVVRLPMDGFVPSYNLQVAISVLAVESLRQRKGD